MSSNFLEIQGLVKRFEIEVGAFKKAHVHALNHVDLTVAKGKTMSIVGESGCGKTTLGKTVLGLHKPDEGNIVFNGREIGALTPRLRRNVQKDLQMIFQDPFSSLNPRKKIGKILSRPLKTFTGMDQAQRQECIEKTCHAVGIDESYLSRYPTSSPAASASASPLPGPLS
ncbi:dipeptide ABC transporter ATP-binding protein [Desulfonema ishimotonii]|uniref:Dipeptide ABC transporter ATP-binding protein n=1 Tax=Desulfonema ishimotonii TaxID=45657 RepID=A0A401G4K5_9BACT|nr:dipeptide ABC transporter ATP-binding protein [Desulfonema ishimotonii]